MFLGSKRIRNKRKKNKKTVKLWEKKVPTFQEILR
jgi:hypothetical protein